MNNVTGNLNNATINIDAGASFIYWKETIAVQHGLKLNINLRHQLQGYQVTIKAPNGYSFRMYDQRNVNGYGARLYPVLPTCNLKLSDMTIVTASPSTNPNPAAVTFPNIATADYILPYNSWGRLIQFLNPDNTANLLPSIRQDQAPGQIPNFYSEVTCNETSFLTKKDANTKPANYSQNGSLYSQYQSIVRIHEIQLKRISDNSLTSIQSLVVPNLALQRFKMNRITINLIPPTSLTPATP